MSREISRRQFLKESAVVSLSVVATGLLGGCGVSADAAVSTTAAASTSAAATTTAATTTVTITRTVTIWGCLAGNLLCCLLFISAH